jgi:hypothetical protein
MTISEVLADFLTCAAGIFAVCFLYPSPHIAREIQYSVSIHAGLLTVLLRERGGTYRQIDWQAGGGSLLQIRATEHALRIPAQSLLLLLLCSFLRC